MNKEIEKKIDEILYDLNNNAMFVIPQPYDHHRTYFDECLKHIKNDGMWMEFGVYRGKSISYIASKTKNIVYGFDSFEGLHEHWDAENPKGVYSLAGDIPVGSIDGNEHHPMMDSSPTIKTKPWGENIKLVKGYFEDSLPIFLEEHKDSVAFMNIDSDLYSSARTVLNLLSDRIVTGTIICFDEICDYPDYRNHEIKAFAEFLIETGFNYKVIAYQPSTYSQGCFVIE